ncbi:TRAP transporter fused permease subunit [Rhodopseudomonas sp. HC1]|uniref:TRAP transporter permease n=1 Tax=Rhodopseudomonas infernalis TaxID=2897386 RepID=UPI001EE7A013|nr:TRAP transporter fused permease subunit [Rhodopseudomonas infernalis]MCG6204529.1 TRAP transporter fused permease subunit [Rhodopseudomonas infernalis]
MTLSARNARFLVGLIAIALAVVQFIPVFASRAIYEISLLSAHVGATTAIAYLVVGLRGRRKEGDDVPLFDVLCAGLALACASYFYMQGARVAERIEGVDPVYTADYVFGIVLILLLLEAARRIAGTVLMSLAVLFILYVFLGPYLPAPFDNRGLSLKRFVDLQLLSGQGIFGTPISASANMVFYFVIVGAFLERSGAGRLFVDLAYCATGRAWGGAAKASIVSSGLFGTVSGSAVANVLMTGVVTIPLMRRTGFSRNFAGAVEATASTGGQLAPPVMGAAAFILADIVGVTYGTVAYAAIVPAVLFYLSLYVLVDSYSRRYGLVPTRDLPLAESWRGLKERWHVLLPLGLMVYLLTSQYSLMRVGAITAVAIIIISWLRATTRLMPRDIYAALVAGARSAAEVAIPSAVAGIIVGILVHTGMALHLERWLLDIAGNSLFVSLIGAMLLTLVFGMGMPTAAAYLVAAILVGPALQNLGVPALEAHLFIFYFAVLSMVTPPVALAAYAAAGVSGGSLWTTGLIAFGLAIPGFIIPFAFVADPALLLQGSALDNVRTVGTAAIGVCATAAASGGFALGRLSLVMRGILFAGGVLLIVPNLTAEIIGFILLALVGLWQMRPGIRSRAAVPPETTSQPSEGTAI